VYGTWGAEGSFCVQGACEREGEREKFY